MKRLLSFFIVLQVFLAYYASGQTMIPLPHPYPFGNGCLCPSEVKGFWFIAPTNLTITGLRTVIGGGIYNRDPHYIQVIKINDPIPALYPATSTNFNTLAYVVGVSGTVQNVNIPINAGDTIGVLGTTALYSNWSTYGTPATSSPYQSNIYGIPITLNTLVYRVNGPGITLGPASYYSVEGSGNPIGMIEVYYKWRMAPPIIRGAGFFCAGDSITLEADPPLGLDTFKYTYLWTLPNGTTSTDSILIFPNAQAGPGGPGGNYSCRVIIDTGSGFDTSFAAYANVFVQAIPPAPQAPALTVYCQGSKSDTIPVHGQNIKWYSVPQGGTATTGQPTINTSVPGTFTYYISQTFNSCEGPRAPVTVQVVPQAPPPMVTSPVMYCQNETAVPLQAVGQNIRWYSVDTGGAGSRVVPTPSTLMPGKTTWYVTQTIDGCESIRVPVEVHVNYRPNALITVSSDWVCEGQTLMVRYQGNAQGNTAVNFNWLFPSGVTVVSGSGEGPYELRFDKAGMQRITLVVDNNGCKSTQVHYDIEVRPVPEFALAIQDDACVGDVVELRINQLSVGIDRFTWDIAGGEKVYASETAGPYGVKWPNGGVKTVSVIAKDGECFSPAMTKDINIHRLPDATISRMDTKGSICTGDTIVLQANFDVNNSYQWLPEGFFKEHNGPSVQTARVTYPATITLHVTDRYNCRSTGEYNILPESCCDVVFPTAFSPNGDGKNEEFRPIGDGHLNVALFVVKNRWGQQVYESRETRRGWDGIYNGTPQDIGVYFYFIKYKCSDGKYYEKSGEVTLLR